MGGLERAMTVRRIWIVCACPVLAAVASAQPPSGTDTTVRDGVYNQEQARRGRATYDARCAACHDGGTMGPELWGDPFLEQWADRDVGAFFNRIRTTMPEDAPGSLSENEVLDVVAYVLQTNGFHPGDKAMQSGSALATMKFVRKKPHEFHGGQRAPALHGLVARVEPVGLKHIGDDVEDFVFAEASGRILGHRGPDPVEERADVPVGPLLQKRIAPELRPHRASIVACGAPGVVRGPAPPGLLLVVHAVAHRRVRAARGLSGRDGCQHRAGTHDPDPANGHGTLKATHSAGSSLPPIGTTMYCFPP